MPRFRSGLFHSSDHFSQIIGAIASFAHALLPSHLDGSAVGLDGYEPVASCASVGFIQAASPGTFGGRSAAKARLLGEDHECRAAGVALGCDGLAVVGPDYEICTCVLVARWCCFVVAGGCLGRACGWKAWCVAVAVVTWLKCQGLHQ
jgi:hypothetical protein